MGNRFEEARRLRLETIQAIVARAQSPEVLASTERMLAEDKAKRARKAEEKAYYATFPGSRPVDVFGEETAIACDEFLIFMRKRHYPHAAPVLHVNKDIAPHKLRGKPGFVRDLSLRFDANKRRFNGYSIGTVVENEGKPNDRRLAFLCLDGLLRTRVDHRYGNDIFKRDTFATMPLVINEDERLRSKAVYVTYEHRGGSEGYAGPGPSILTKIPSGESTLASVEEALRLHAGTDHPTVVIDTSGGQRGHFDGIE